MKRGSKIAWSYLACAMLTFGVAASGYQRDSWARYSACASRPVAQPEPNECRQPWAVDAPMIGLLSGAFWPLYWSWVGVDQARIFFTGEEPVR